MNELLSRTYEPAFAFNRREGPAFALSLMEWKGRGRSVICAGVLDGMEFGLGTSTETWTWTATIIVEWRRLFV